MSCVEPRPNVGVRAGLRAAVTTLPCRVDFAAKGCCSGVPPADVLLAHAGCTEPFRPWIDALAPGGRALLPLTVSVGMPGNSGGWMLQVEREATALRLGMGAPVMVFGRAAWRDVAALSFETHEKGPNCRMHVEGWCLAAAGPGR